MKNPFLILLCGLALLFTACNAAQQEQALAQKHQKGVLIVYFWGATCRSCAMQDKELNAFRQTSSVPVEKIQPDKPTIAKYKLTHFPTMIFYKDGVEADRTVGVTYADQLAKIVRRLEGGAL